MSGGAKTQPGRQSDGSALHAQRHRRNVRLRLVR
jgi:hypothetical protein